MRLGIYWKEEISSDEEYDVDFDFIGNECFGKGENWTCVFDSKFGYNNYYIV